MKKIVLATIAFALALPATGVFAQDKAKKEGMNCMDMKEMDMKGMDCMKMPNKQADGKQSIHRAKGVVRKIDAKAGMVTVAHEPVQSMNWPAMTMGFKVNDATLLKKFVDGNTVEFEFAKEGNDYVVTSLK